MCCVWQWCEHCQGPAIYQRRHRMLSAILPISIVKRTGPHHHYHHPTLSPISYTSSLTMLMKKAAATSDHIIGIILIIIIWKCTRCLTSPCIVYYRNHTIENDIKQTNHSIPNLLTGKKIAGLPNN
ncbi:unnamed protein product [Absidia cylindrospora]